MKPILFNQAMVRAILDGRKTCTRRVVKGYVIEHIELDTDGSIIGVYDQFDGHVMPIMDYAPYHPGDILYVRETWMFDTGDDDEEGTGYFAYKADGEESPTGRWRPSIHMPKEAARLFLHVTDVRVERLQEITEEQAILEGIEKRAVPVINASNVFEYCIPGTHNVCISGRGAFSHLWDSTIPKDKLPVYGWNASPWVWAYRFDRISKEEALNETNL